MYSLTWIEFGTLREVCSPSRDALETLFLSLLSVTPTARLWKRNKSDVFLLN